MWSNNRVLQRKKEELLPGWGCTAEDGPLKDSQLLEEDFNISHLVPSNPNDVFAGNETIKAFVEQQDIRSGCMKVLRESRRTEGSKLSKEVTYIPGLQGCVSSGQRPSFAP